MCAKFYSDRIILCRPAERPKFPLLNLYESTLVTMIKKTKPTVRAILYLFLTRVQRPVALQDLQKVLSLFLVARDGTAERADEGDARKAVHHP